MHEGREDYVADHTRCKAAMEGGPGAGEMASRDSVKKQLKTEAFFHQDKLF